MDTSLSSVSKNLVDFFKEIYFFTFHKEDRVNTDQFTINLIAYLSKNASIKKYAYELLNSVLHKKSNDKHYDQKMSNLYITLKSVNSDIVNLNTNEDINILFYYLKNKKKKVSNLTLKESANFNNFLINKVYNYQNIFRISLITIFVVSLILSLRFDNNTFILLNFANLILFYPLKHNKYHKLYNLIKMFTTKDTIFENSLLYRLTEQYDTEWFHELKKENQKETLVNKNIQLITQKKLEKEVFIVNLEEKKINSNILNDSDINYLLEIEKFGIFRITNELKNIEQKDKESLIFKVFDFAVKQENILIKSNLIQNISLIIQNDYCANTIKKWFNNQKINISIIIDKTDNKINVLHLFSRINKVKMNLSSNPNAQKEGVIDNLNTIENTVLENMSFDNFIDIFSTLSDKKNKYKLINME